MPYPLIALLESLPSIGLCDYQVYGFASNSGLLPDSILLSHKGSHLQCHDYNF